MKNYTRILSILTLALLTIALPATAQTNDKKNKAIVETTDGTQELNTDDISVIRFDSGKITIEQPWGNTTYDRTLRSLSFLRPLPGTLRLTATTNISTNNGGNRAQAIDSDGDLKSTWAEGDVVYVYADASTTTSIGTLTPKSYGASTATLTGNINADGLSNGQTLYFSTKNRATLDLTSQDGTVESLFYFEATAPITIDGGNASVGNLSFARPIAVVKFTLKDKGNSDAAISATSLTVSDGTNIYNVAPTSATDVLYVGIPAISSATVTLYSTDGDQYYYYQKTGVTFANNKYYAINVKMEASELARPLTFEAKTAGATVTLKKNGSAPIISMKYSTDGTNWTTYTVGNAITLASVGDKVMFRGTNNTLALGANNRYHYFFLSGDCYAYGNVMSLLSANDFAFATSLSSINSFCSLFTDCITLYSHPEKALVLPATTLAAYCYAYMFQGCTNLTTAPALPAETLQSNCYYGMFYGCTSLTTAPALPAETLAVSCYSGMFYGCTSLATAPALPAETLANYCYYRMFYGCTSLTTAPDLPATTLASYCYANMFLNCTGLTTAPTILPATILVANCYISMFDGCKELTTAPVLPAATLQNFCYAWMFDGCNKLNNVTCLATNISADNCTNYWLHGVAATGTFTKAASMTGWTSGASGIPSGWTVKNAVPTGTINGLFTVSDDGGTTTKQVYFSQGNLQATYNGSAWSWAFATNQWDHIGNAAANTSINGNGTVSANGTVDLFGWVGASSSWTGAAQYGISNSTTLYSADTYGNVAYEALKSDWGNTIGTGWRMLTGAEWAYLFNTRASGSTVNGTSNARYTHATINTDGTSVNGIILFPDGVDFAASEFTTLGTVNGASTWATKCTSAQWTALAAKGCVFLPAAGNRSGASVSKVGSTGYYWTSSSPSITSNAYLVYFYGGSLNTNSSDRRSNGYSVRLVRAVE